MQQISTNTLNTNVQKDLNFTWSTQAILFCAIIIACIGLNVDSAPVVIGAMLISPLMAPIVGIGYGLGNSNTKLLSKATKLFLIQVIIGVVGATIYFLVSIIKHRQRTIAGTNRTNALGCLDRLFRWLCGSHQLSEKRRWERRPRRCNRHCVNAATLYGWLWD